MSFNIGSFLIGFLSATVMGFILYRLRDRIVALRRTAESRVGQTREFISNSAEGRYYEFITKRLNAAHLAGDHIALAELYVEPRFLAAPPPADPNAERIDSIFHAIPVIHDLPASYAPYNIEAMGINDLRAGERQIALLGLPGSGRSTALAVLGLVASGAIDLPELDLLEDETFETEVKDLPPAEREKRIKARKELQDRALKQIKDEQRGAGGETPAALIPSWREFIPIYIHLSEIDLRPEVLGIGADGKKAARALDPAEPLVLAMQRSAGGVVASTLPRVIYSRLTAGKALVMFDGFDELSEADRPAVIAWLSGFLSIYRANFIVVTAGVGGYDTLANIGFTPLYLRAWQDTDYTALVGHWATGWTQIGKQGRKAAAIPAEKIVRRAEANNRARLPLDVSLKAWAAFADDEKEVGRRGWYDFYARHFAAELRPYFEKLAAASLEANGAPLTHAQIKEMITAAVTGADGKPTANPDDLTNKLIKSVLLRALPGDRYAFAHPLIAAFLASETLQETTLAAAAGKPAWEIAMPFAAARLNFEAVAQARLLDTNYDLLYTGVFSLVPCLIDSPASAQWKGTVFKQLGAALLQPSQFPAIRERAMAALVSSRDKGVLFVLREGLKTPLPVIRRLCCVGLGALGEPDGVREISPALNDSDPDVQLAAGMALAAIGTPGALETMLQGLLTGDPQLRRAVAEALAALPDVGHPTLRDAIVSSELDVRRAAVYGVARIKKAWALALLYKTMLEDGEWVVRNAAQQAWGEAQRPDRISIHTHPQPDQIAWLVSWAADRGEGVPVGPNGRQVLVRALQEGDPVLRAAAAKTLGTLGHHSALKALYTALRDPDEGVRTAAYDSLAALQTRLGMKLPALN